MNERAITKTARRLISACRSRGLAIPSNAERLRSIPGSLSYAFAVDGEGYRTTITIDASGVSASLQRLAGAAVRSHAPKGLTFDALALWIEARPLEV